MLANIELKLYITWKPNILVTKSEQVPLPYCKTGTEPVGYHRPGPILTLILLMWRIRWANNTVPVYLYIQQDATLHSLFISGNCSICFGWYFHPSSGAHTTVSTASGICHTVTAICRYRGRVGTDFRFISYATHSTLKPVPTLPR
jgi:hypothetical protein